MKTVEKLSRVYNEKIRMPRESITFQDDIVGEIRQTRALLDAAYDRFDIENDEMMLESVIYEIQSLRARYRFLLRLARKSGAECAVSSVFER